MKNSLHNNWKDWPNIGEMASFEKDDFIYRPEDSADHLFIVNQGAGHPDPNWMRIKVWGSILGHVSQETCSVLHASARPVEQDAPKYTLAAICTEKTVVFSFDVSKLIQFCETDAAFGYLLLSKINQVYFKTGMGLAKRALRKMIKESNIVTKFTVA